MDCAYSRRLYRFRSLLSMSVRQSYFFRSATPVTMRLISYLGLDTKNGTDIDNKENFKEYFSTLIYPCLTIMNSSTLISLLSHKKYFPKEDSLNFPLYSNRLKTPIIFPKKNPSKLLKIFNDWVPTPSSQRKKGGDSPCEKPTCGKYVRSIWVCLY